MGTARLGGDPEGPSTASEYRHVLSATCKTRLAAEASGAQRKLTLDDGAGFERNLGP